MEDEVKCRVDQVINLCIGLTLSYSGLCKFPKPYENAHIPPYGPFRHGVFAPGTTSARDCSPSAGSAGVRLSYFNGEPAGFCGDAVPVLGVVSRGIGEIVPLGGTGILMSSGDGGIISVGRPSIFMRDDSLL